jgi:hypothetical protein
VSDRKRMTLTMEFDRDVPDDRTDLLLTVNARALSLALHTVDEHLRSRIKYGQLCEESIEELQAVRDKLREELGPLVEAVFG